MTRSTTTIAALLSLPVFFAGCNNEEAPASRDALEQAQQRQLEENASRASGSTATAPRDSAEPDTQEPVQPTTPPVTVPDTSGVTLDGVTIDAGGVTMRTPASWEQQEPTSSMRAAQYGVGDSGEFVVFAGIGGGVDANINRWIGQISNPQGDPSRDTIRKGDLVIHTVEMTGTYQGMSMSGATPPQRGTTFFGAVIEGAATPLQVRLTIDADEAEAAREQWYAMLNSMVSG